MNKYQRRYKHDIQTILGSIRISADASIKATLVEYMKLSRPFYTPVYLPQDLSKKEGRFCDLLGGFPYTSVDFPWPTDSRTGEYLQPVAQLGLSKVGRLLQRNLGTGFIQVWGYSTEAYGQLRFELRTIGGVSEKDVLSDFFPENIARAVDLGESRRNEPRLLWRSGGGMFLGNLEFVCGNQNESFSYSDYCGSELVDVEDGVLCDQLGILIAEDYEILDHVRSLPYFGTYLGGHGGGSGSLGWFLNLDPQDSLLILRAYCDEDDSNFGVFAKYEDDGKIAFDLESVYL